MLHAISNDLKVGTTAGWLVNDPDGNPIRVLVDVGFFCGELPSSVEVKPFARAHGCGTLLSVRRSKIQWGGVPARRCQLFFGYDSCAHNCSDPCCAPGDQGARLLMDFFCFSVLRAHRLPPNNRVKAPYFSLSWLNDVWRHPV